MSRFNGRHHRGYMQVIREEKRAEAEQRNAVTPYERTRKGRRYAEALTIAKGGRRTGRRSSR